jgi:hypothetical protein
VRAGVYSLASIANVEEAVTRPPLSMIGCVLGLLTGCKPETLETCRKAWGENDFARAAKICERVYATTNDPRAGANALLAHNNLDHRAEVRAQDGAPRVGGRV